MQNKELINPFLIKELGVFGLIPPSDMSPSTFREMNRRIQQYEQQYHVYGYIPELVKQRTSNVNIKLFQETIKEVGNSKILDPSETHIAKHFPHIRDLASKLDDPTHRQALVSTFAAILGLFPVGPILGSMSIEIGINLPNMWEAWGKAIKTNSAHDIEKAIRYTFAFFGEGILGIGLASTIVHYFGLKAESLIASGSITGTSGWVTGLFTNTYIQRLADTKREQIVRNKNLRSIQQNLLSPGSTLNAELVSRIMLDPSQLEKTKHTINHYLVKSINENGEFIWTSTQLLYLQSLYKLVKINTFNEPFLIYYQRQIELEEMQVESAVRLQDILNNVLL